MYLLFGLLCENDFYQRYLSLLKVCNDPFGNTLYIFNALKQECHKNTASFSRFLPRQEANEAKRRPIA